MQVELAQLTGRDGDTAHNLAQALQAIAACRAGTRLLVFPETYLTGFPTPENVAALAEPLDGPSLTAIGKAAAARGLAVAIGFAEDDGGTFYNTTVLMDGQDIVLTYRKTHLWASDRGVFAPGDRYATALLDGVRVGLLVCFDIEFPESARALGELGAELLIVTNGNMDPYGPTHRTAIMARAMENQAYAVMTNRVGAGDDGLVFAGGSAVVDPNGNLLLEAGREPCAQSISLDFHRLAEARRDYRYLEERRITLPGTRIDHANGVRELLIP
jgi:(R)-amidase